MRILTLFLLVAAVLGLVAIESDPLPALPKPRAETSPSLDHSPIVFVENQGQWKHSARYVARMGALTAFLEDRGWIFTLEEDAQRPTQVDPRGPHEEDLRPEPVRGVAVRMRFEGNADLPVLAAEGKLSGYHNYILGNDPSRWRSYVPLHTSVRYPSMYPGVDVRVREDKGRLEYDLLLEPGADLSQVVVHVDGADGLTLEPDGTLELATALGPVRQPPPTTWEVMPAGERHPIACRYELLGRDRFGFSVPAWEGDLALVVDPKLVWSTFVGGSGGDQTYALAGDVSGESTIAGRTHSTDFPTTPGAYQTTRPGGSDALVARLDRNGTRLLWATFLGGRNSTNREQAECVALDSAGKVYVAGVASSNDFPTTPGAFDQTYNGRRGSPYDAFVACLDAKGSSLLWSTFLGGATDNDFGYAIAVAPSGVVTVAGDTGANDFPTTPGAYDQTHGGNGGCCCFGDGFVTRLDPSKLGTQQLVWSTFLGGKGDDSCPALALSADGTVTVVGGTCSEDFPTTPNAFDRTYGGKANCSYGDGFVTRLDRTGSTLLYSTFLGGTKGDKAFCLSVDPSGVITVGGGSESPLFPTTAGAWSTSLHGYMDGFVARLDPGKPANQQLVWSTLLGGSGQDRTEEVRSVAVEASGAVVLVGFTDSLDFPTTPDAWDRSHNGMIDAFVARLDGRGRKLLHSTYLGGRDRERTRDNGFAARPVQPNGALVLLGRNVVTVAGTTSSSDFPATPGAHDPTYNGGGSDAFITRLHVMPDGVQRYGDSTPGCQGHPTIHALDHAQAGSTTFGVACTRVPGAAPGVLLVSALGLKSPLKVLGIDIWVDLRFTTAFVLKPLKADEGYETIQKFGLPLWTKGMRFESQYVWFDPSCPKTPFCASEALSVAVW